MKNIPFELPVTITTCGGKKLARELIKNSAYVDVMSRLKSLGISNSPDTDHFVGVDIAVLDVDKASHPEFGEYYKYSAIVSVGIIIVDMS